MYILRDVLNFTFFSLHIYLLPEKKIPTERFFLVYHLVCTHHTKNGKPQHNDTIEVLMASLFSLSYLYKALHFRAYEPRCCIPCIQMSIILKVSCAICPFFWRTFSCLDDVFSLKIVVM